MDMRGKAITNGGAIRNHAAATMDVRDEAVHNGGEIRNGAAAVMDMRDKAIPNGGAIRNSAALADALQDDGVSGAIRAYAIRPYSGEVLNDATAETDGRDNAVHHSCGII